MCRETFHYTSGNSSYYYSIAFQKTDETSLSPPVLSLFDIIFRADNNLIEISMTPLTHITENVFKLRKTDRIIGFYLYDKFNEPIARIDAVLVDSQSYHSFYLVINLGGFLQVSGKAVVLPVEVCEVKDLGKVKTEWRKESMLGAPAPIDITSLTTLEEELIRDYYALPLQRPCPLKNWEE